jgi:hypothetical protein
MRRMALSDESMLIRLNTALRFVLAALLVFVLAAAPLPHAVAMPLGHHVTNSVVESIKIAKTGHHHTQQQADQKASGCGESSDDTSAKEPCCDVGCLSLAQLNEALELAQPFAAFTAIAVVQDDLDSRLLYGLKRPPRA